MLAWLAGVFATFLSSSVARWIAWKTIISLVVITILPIVLNNIMYDVIEAAIGLVSSNASGVTSWVAVFTGLTAFLFQHLRVPDCISVLMSAIAVRYTLGLIPFVRV